MSIPFEVIINKISFASLCTDPNLSPIDNKSVLGLINGFEDEKWKYEDFQDYIWNNLQETALSAKERQALYYSPQTLLKKSARNLKIVQKADQEKGGEIAEILLYGIMKDYYGALPVVPKIYYKQNSQDPAKGADSVHIVIESQKSFSLWLGEEKFFNSIEDNRLYNILDSVHDNCISANIKKEISIVTGIRDLDDLKIDAEIRKKIIGFLEGNPSTDDIKPILHIPIMLLYECNLTKNQKERDNTYIQAVYNYQVERANSYFKKQINRCKDIAHYSKINFHLILFPVPEKQPILDSFREHAQFYRK